VTSIEKREEMEGEEEENRGGGVLKEDEEESAPPPSASWLRPWRAAKVTDALSSRSVRKELAL
jgi:hypothetical protein